MVESTVNICEENEAQFLQCSKSNKNFPFFAPYAIYIIDKPQQY